MRALVLLSSTILSVSACVSATRPNPPAPSPTPTATPSPTSIPTLKPTPTPPPTPVTGRVFAPKEARAGDAFLVRAWWPFETSVQLYADGTWLLGTMGWNRYCGCKELAVLLGTPGARRLAASIDGVVVETVVVEVR